MKALMLFALAGLSMSIAHAAEPAHQSGAERATARPAVTFLFGYLVQPFFSLVLDRRNGSALS